MVGKISFLDFCYSKTCLDNLFKFLEASSTTSINKACGENSKYEGFGSSIFNMQQNSKNSSSMGLKLFFIERGFFSLSHWDSNDEVVAICKMSVI